MSDQRWAELESRYSFGEVWERAERTEAEVRELREALTTARAERDEAVALLTRVDGTFNNVSDWSARRDARAWLAEHSPASEQRNDHA